MIINIKSLARATSATIILIVVLTIAGELYEPLEELLKGFGGHHWIGKGLVALIFFAIFYLLLALASGADETDFDISIKRAVWSAVFGGVVIFAFFIMHFLSVL